MNYGTFFLDQARDRRSAAQLLAGMEISAARWQTLRGLLHEPDAVLAIEASKLGIRFASGADRKLMAHRLIWCLSPNSWGLRKDIEDILVALKHEAAGEIEEEIARRLEQPEDLRWQDTHLRALLRVKRRWQQACAPCQATAGLD